VETSTLQSILAIALILSGIVGVVLGAAVILMFWKHRKEGTGKGTGLNPAWYLAMVTIFTSMILLQVTMKSLDATGHWHVTSLGFLALILAGLAFAVCCFSLGSILVKHTREGP
jgi:hypothetical protein